MSPSPTWVGKWAWKQPVLLSPGGARSPVSAQGLHPVNLGWELRQLLF